MMQRFTRENVCESVTYISWSSDLVLYLEDYLMDKYHSWNVWIHVMQRLATQNVCGSMTYISWSSDSDFFYLEDIFMEECWIEDIDSV